MAKFISFYSYKGGVGRTLSLVNVAAALAKEGKSVLIWDLDLEAPGIQTFPLLNRFGIEEEIKTGVIDILLDFQEKGFKIKGDKLIKSSIYSFKSENLPDDYKALGKIQVLPAGKLEQGYTEKFSRIEWEKLFDGEENIGFQVFEECLKVLDDLDFDYVLIDSRTGLTHIALVTTILLPDLVFLVFNYNEQNLRGLNSIHAALHAEEIQKRIRKFPLPVKTIASMVDFEASSELKKRQKRLKEKFNIKPHYEIAFHRPLITLEDILPFSDEHKKLEATQEYYNIAAGLIDFYPRRIEEEEKKIRSEEVVYKINTGEGRGMTFREREPVYRTGKTFEEKTGEIFRLMGFEVEFDRETAGKTIDIFLKKKKSIGQKYEYYICECKDWPYHVDKDVVDELSFILEEVKEELKIGCEAIIVTRVGFTGNAKKAAQDRGIELHTYEDMLTGLMNFDNYLTGLIQGFEGTDLERLYIEQDVIPENNPEEINSFDFVDSWLQSPGQKHFSLLGDYGTGKTSFARKLAYDMAKKYKAEPGKNRIPFFIDLRQCQKALSLETLLHEQLKNSGVEPANEEIFLKLLAEGKILLIFDAFDEMATMSNAEITLSNFRQLNRAVEGEAKVIMASRTHYFRDKYEVDTILKKQGVKGLSEKATLLYREIHSKPEYEIVYLKEFSEKQVKEYLKKAVGKEWRAAYDKIESIYNLHDLAARPVLLDMIVKTLPKIETGRDEFNVVDLYDVYTLSWFDRDDHRLQITKAGREELVEALAYKLWQEGKTSIHYSALSDVLSKHLKSKIKNLRDLETADYEVRTASFLVRDGEGNYAFAHKSFQEFFIARKIKKGLLEKDYSVLNLKRLSLEIVFFLKHMMADQDILTPVSDILAGKYREQISENALLLFYRVLKMGFLKQRFSLQGEANLCGAEGKTFAQLLRHNLPKEINLPGARLGGLDLSCMVFKRADLSGADLEESLPAQCVFEDTSLKQAVLKSSAFSASTFKNVDFEKAAAHGADFKDCVFENCALVDADFSLVNFMNAGFEDCTIKGSDFTAAGFLGSNIDIKQLKQGGNDLFGAPLPPVPALHPLPALGHGNWVNSAALSGDNRFIVSAGYDKTVKVWDFESGKLLNTLKGHDNWVNSVALSGDNRFIVSGSSDNTVKV
ncbi:MAG: NACHT domain-containing protein, partial [Candidatus Aminicenantes bacterium]|nr:NACHT domain-containing protein [Candidatus Aminicenantes bacterium]